MKYIIHLLTSNPGDKNPQYAVVSDDSKIKKAVIVNGQGIVQKFSEIPEWIEERSQRKWDDESYGFPLALDYIVREFLPEGTDLKEVEAHFTSEFCDFCEK